MSMSGFLANFIPDILRRRFTYRSQGAPILRLPLDIHVDEIFIYLYIEDILSLRQVNKAFFLLTHEPIIWKRFLERLNIPIPPLRPTFRYSVSLTDYEIEQLVTQAITVDDNWRRPDPMVYNRQIALSHNKVLDMRLLPGGKFLVASVKDRCNYRFYIVVFALDHPKGPRALARIPTFTKAYNIEAKFMKLFAEEEGLVISYVRRRLRNGAPTEVDASDYSHHTCVDVPGGFSYDAVCVYVSLSMLEYLSSPDMELGSEDYLKSAMGALPPFKELGIVETDYEIDQLNLFEINGYPFLGMIVKPAEIVFIDLMHKTRTTLVCKPYHQYSRSPHRIRAFRPYPGQTDMIVIRTIALDPGDELHVIESYDMPTAFGVTTASAKARYVIYAKDVHKFHISDYGLSGRTKYQPDHPNLRHSLGPPPPISIFLETRNPAGVEHHAIYPKQEEYMPATDGQAARYRYTYDHDSYQMSTHICHPHHTRVLPGAYRAMLYTVHKDDRTDSPAILNLRRYIHPKNSGISYEPDPIDEPEPVLRNTQRLRMPRKDVYRSFEAPQLLEEINQVGGIAAIAWDESTGRTCIAAEEVDEIRILDCAHMVMPDARMREWLRKQDFLLQS